MKAIVRGPQKILLPLDESRQAFGAVEYCAQVVANLKKPQDVRVKLLLIECLPDSSEYEDMGDWEHECVVVKTEFNNALDSARNRLVECGIDAQNIEAGYVVQKDCSQVEAADMRDRIARCIFQEQQKEEFDTLIMARREQTKAQAYLSGSVTRRILDMVKDCTVWLVC